jgi:hypothetical protein
VSLATILRNKGVNFRNAILVFSVESPKSSLNQSSSFGPSAGHVFLDLITKSIL